jgi:hypothetical protein
MKRRYLLLSALFSLPDAAFATFQRAESRRRLKKPVVLRANQSRFDGETRIVKDAIVRCVISTADTDGDLLVMASGDATFGRKGGPPLHIHKYQDEVFFVVPGEFLRAGRRTGSQGLDGRHGVYPAWNSAHLRQPDRRQSRKPDLRSPTGGKE